MFNCMKNLFPWRNLVSFVKYKDWDSNVTNPGKQFVRSINICPLIYSSL